jgi:hypothetical protein
MTRAIVNRLVKVEDHFGLGTRYTSDGDGDPTPEQQAAARACLIALLETRGPLSPAEVAEVHVRLDAMPPVRLTAAGREHLARLLSEKGQPSPHDPVDGTTFERW